MSEDDRKSMDDVLASIRRIVRTERQDVDAGEGGREGLVQDTDAEEPLILTPEMRIDLGDGPGVGPGDNGFEAGTADAVPVAAAPDREALRALLREVLQDELGEALADGRAAEAVRGIVRDELVNGETGDNVSQNVLRLIRDEVRRALDER